MGIGTNRSKSLKNPVRASTLITEPDNATSTCMLALLEA
jgi:hypothetical protein